jgi:hypothetical protein
LVSGKSSSGKAAGRGAGTAGVGAGRAKLQGKDRDMGSALRSVYQKTVDEKIPDEFLDLLGKLD